MMPRPHSPTRLFQSVPKDSDQPTTNAFSNPDVETTFNALDQPRWLAFSDTVIDELSEMFDNKKAFEVCYWHAAQQRQKIAAELKHGESHNYTDHYGKRRCTQPQSISAATKSTTEPLDEKTIEQYYNTPKKKQPWPTESVKIFNELPRLVNKVITESETIKSPNARVYDGLRYESFQITNCSVDRITVIQDELNNLKKYLDILSQYVEDDSITEFSTGDYARLIQLASIPEEILSTPTKKKILMDQLRSKKEFDDLSKTMAIREKFPESYEIEISYKGIKLAQTTYSICTTAPEESEIVTAYVDIKTKTIESQLFAEAQTLFDAVLACSKGETEPFLKALGKLSYIMAHFLPVRRGNAGIMYWIQHALAKYVEVELNGYRRDDTELSWDFKALITPDIDEYAEWFAQKVFVLDKTPAPTSSLSPAIK